MTCLLCMQGPRRDVYILCGALDGHHAVEGPVVEGYMGRDPRGIHGNMPLPVPFPSVKCDGMMSLPIDDVFVLIHLSPSPKTSSGEKFSWTNTRKRVHYQYRPHGEGGRGFSVE